MRKISIISVLFSAFLISSTQSFSGPITLYKDFNATLSPGVWTGWILGPSSSNRGYVPEITPIGPSVNGASISNYVVQPEYDGTQWNDVLRAQIRATQPTTDVNIRVYNVSGLPLATNFNTTLQPGNWAGWVLGPSSSDRGFVPEISPLNPSVNGASVYSVVQPETNGTVWIDVLRTQIPATQPPTAINIKAYEVSGLPLVANFNTTLIPGNWGGWSLGPSSVDRGYVAEISPMGPNVNGASIEKYIIHPEYDGTQWIDVLRVQISANQPPTPVNLRVYAIQADVPEPATIVLFGLGVGVLAGIVGQTKRKNVDTAAR